MRRGGLLLVWGAGLATLAAQNVDYRQDQGWQPPARAASRLNPLPATPEVVGGGRKLYVRHCAECHRGDGQGGKRGADLLLPFVQAQSDGALFWKISNGNARRGMPSWNRLPEPQRWQLVLYLRTLPGAFAAGEASR